ncbi:Metal-dependent hydrolases of the beta-lactamase superfamily I [Thermoplasmatales archaeon BRNA1]|nr:Metal-dependent hydrolases of the beta-lactamase superfamily I [Thermoplasmatales archaeon BRNA1]
MSFGITFLGTGGGRHTTIFQTRSTGGMLIEHDGHYLHIDPGPGALESMKRLRYDPGLTESVIVSHCHPDHYSDAPSVIEGMTHGGWKKRGRVYGSETVMTGTGGLGPAISAYHLQLPVSSEIIRPGDVLDIDGMKVEVTRAKHSDPTNMGFKFHTGHGIVSYLSDTEYTEEIGEQYMGSRVLILPVTTPSRNLIRWHMNTDEAIKIAKQVRPELVIFIHLGIVMIENDPVAQAAMCEKESGVPTVAGEDFMHLDVGESLLLGKLRTYYESDGFWVPEWCPPANFGEHTSRK